MPRTPSEPSTRTPNVTCAGVRSEEHTSELQSHVNLVCRLLLEKKNIGCFSYYVVGDPGDRVWVLAVTGALALRSVLSRLGSLAVERSVDSFVVDAVQFSLCSLS